MSAQARPQSKRDLADAIRRLDSSMPASVLVRWSPQELRQQLARLQAYAATVNPAKGVGRRCY